MDALRLENISFSYNGSEKIFDNVNFTLEYGDFVLLSGVSGEGKSTLLSIINGMIPFITPGKLEGKIYVNSEDVTDVRVSERARLIGTVLQNADEQIVYDIVRDEIAFGCENLDIPVETIDRRIEASTNMMKISPDAKTRTMSGGQKQRLCIARALLKSPKVLILDDSTSAVDTATDAKIRQAFATKIPNTTKIIISQRISSVQDADRIIVLDNGMVSGFDTHENLLKNNTIYKEIYDVQMSGGGDFDEKMN